MTSAPVQEQNNTSSDFSGENPDEQPEIGRRLKRVREKRRWSQPEMAAHIGVSASYIWQLEAGTKKPGPKIVREVEMMEQAPSSFSRVDKPFPKPVPGGDIMRDVQITVPRYIPVLTLAQAGDVLVAYENLPMHFTEKVPTDLADPKAFAFRVQGDSMQPHFSEGDRLIVSPAQEVRNGEIVLARLVNGDTLVKLYHESKNGREIQLGSFNPAYPPKTYRRTDFEAIVKVVQRVQDVSIDLLRRQF